MDCSILSALQTRINPYKFKENARGTIQLAALIYNKTVVQLCLFFADSRRFYNFCPLAGLTNQHDTELFG